MGSAEPDLLHFLIILIIRIPNGWLKPFAIIVNREGMIGIFDAGVQSEIMVAMFPPGNKVDKSIDYSTRRAQSGDSIPNA